MAAEASAATRMASGPEVREDRGAVAPVEAAEAEVAVAVEGRSRQNRTVSRNVPFDETQSNFVALNMLNMGGATKLGGAL
jgi:hypothetical protein